MTSAQTAGQTLHITPAATPPWMSSPSRGYGTASQLYNFIAETVGTKLFSFDYCYTVDLRANRDREWARGDLTIGIYLSRHIPGYWPEYWWTHHRVDEWVYNEQALQYSVTGTIYVQGEFDQGDFGDISINIWPNVIAHSVPAPGALLLAGIGTAVVGWLRGRVA